ncbi:1272_t:CDS:2 [Funneliformis caledonium]|uniref:1272_t:CDS:1 n=1 Tax=Funneliformis caledonium TaxID=1117310 RepID=A0A9N9G686_9GLOM|nr:1272_t:CDS:2 [Funneliformis caledonium]
MLTSDQDEQDLSQSYETSSEKELKSNQHNEVIIKLDKNIIVK